MDSIQLAELEHQGCVTGHAAGQVQCQQRVHRNTGGLGCGVAPDQPLGTATVQPQLQLVPLVLEAVGLTQGLEGQQQVPLLLQQFHQLVA